MFIQTHDFSKILEKYFIEYLSTLFPSFERLMASSAITSGFLIFSLIKASLSPLLCIILTHVKKKNLD